LADGRQSGPTLGSTYPRYGLPPPHPLAPALKTAVAGNLAAHDSENIPPPSTKQHPNSLLMASFGEYLPNHGATISKFVRAVMYVCDLVCPEPSNPPFHFNPTQEAAQHNGAVFSAFGNNLGAVIDAYPSSSISYGSEFRPPDQLQQIWGHHPFWPKLLDTITLGSSYNLLNQRCPMLALPT